MFAQEVRGLLVWRLEDHAIDIIRVCSVSFSVVNYARAIGCSIVLAIFCPLDSHADVYAEIRKPLSSNTDAMVDILSDSVSPGGTRNVSINGNNFLVQRYVNPNGDNSNFFNIWNDVSANKESANLAIRSTVESRDPVLEIMTGGIPYRSLSDNFSAVFDAGLQFSKEQSKRLREQVIEALHTPFSYETSRFRAIASIPVHAIDPNSELVKNNNVQGQLFLAEKLPGSTASSAFWHFQFDDEFDIGEVFAADNTGLNDPIPPYPGSRRTLVFTEKANGWNSNSWSYESTGDVLSHLTYYIDAFAKKKYAKENNVVLETNYALMQFSGEKDKATLFIELLEPATQAIQVTLQLQN